MQKPLFFICFWGSGASQMELRRKYQTSGLSAFRELILGGDIWSQIWQGKRGEQIDLGNRIWQEKPGEYFDDGSQICQWKPRGYFVNKYLSFLFPVKPMKNMSSESIKIFTEYSLALSGSEIKIFTEYSLALSGTELKIFTVFSLPVSLLIARLIHRRFTSYLHGLFTAL